MPSRNITKEQASESYYHVYARGNNKQKLFIDSLDYKYFLKLFDRYLSKEKAISKARVTYPNYSDEIEIVAYCLMSNHFHLMVYQANVPNLEKFMRSIMTSYSRYFNLKYKRTGSLFESRYKASRIYHEIYFQHITRYIHLNPRNWASHRYSSLGYYRSGNEPCWLYPGRVLDLFASRSDYMKFVSDYEEMRNSLNDIKYLLADR
jgi:REP element-mobilizing transposase RayT